MNKLMTLLKNTSTTVKVVGLSLSAILSVIINMKVALLGLLTLITIDLITGIAKSLYTNNRSCNPLKVDFWKSIKSYMLRKTWRKAYEYGIGIIVVIIFETLVFGGGSNVIFMDKAFTLAELSVIVPALVEVWSIFENIEAISGNNMFKKVTSFLPPKIQNALKNKKVD